MSENLTVANAQWQSRPVDQRFVSLPALAAYKAHQKRNSKAAVIPNRNITVLPSATDRFDLAVNVKSASRGIEYACAPTHWAFGQVCQRAGAPTGYMRGGLPAALVADNLNWGLHYGRTVEDCQILFSRRDCGGMELQAVTGPDYGRVWDADIAHSLVENFGDGISGQWRVPGEFGKKLENVTPENTTLYASDSDMFVFLADEDRRIELPNRRDGKVGSLARGFYISNSQVGKAPLVFGMFLFDYVCQNRIIWGAEQHREIRIVHRSGAPNRWLEEVKPVLDAYAKASPMAVEGTLKAAQDMKIRGDVEEWLESRFGKGMAENVAMMHLAEEGRPVETVWDAVVGATAYARGIEYVDRRVEVERAAGKLLQLVG